MTLFGVTLFAGEICPQIGPVGGLDVDVVAGRQVGNNDVVGLTWDEGKVVCEVR